MRARPSLEAYLLPLTRTEVKKAGPVGHPCCGLGGLLFQVAHTRDPSKGSPSPVNHSGRGWWNVFLGEAWGFCVGGLSSASIYERHKCKDVASPP